MQVDPKWKKPLKLLLKVGVTALAFWWISGKISWTETLSVLSHARLFYFIPALLLFNASKIVSAFRLELFWEAVGLHISRMKNLALYYLGMFYNLFLPGGIGGDGYKVWLLHKRTGIKTGLLVQAVLIDRVSGVIPLIILATLVFFSTTISAQMPWLIIVVVLLFGIAVYFVGYFIVAQMFSTFRKVFHRAAIQGAGVQLLQAGSALCIVWALRIDQYILTYIFLFLVSSIVAVIPLTIGGAGAREWAMVTGCLWLTLDKEAAVALGLIFFLITALSSLSGAFLPARTYQPGQQKT